MAITILPAARTFGAEFGRALGAGTGAGIKEHFEKKEVVEQLKQENEQLKKLGIDLSGIKNPETRKALIPSMLKENERKQEAKQQEEYLSALNQEEETGNKFNFNDPSSWSDKQLDKLRSVKSKSPKMQTLATSAENEYQKRKEEKKLKTKYEENMGPLEGALETVDQMIKLGKKGNLGLTTGLRKIFSKETRKDSAEYQRLGKSLISFASNIPIRNKQEFETLARDLYDPSINDASREGILNAMKKIIQNTMKGFVSPEEEDSLNANPMKKERPPLESFIR